MTIYPRGLIFLAVAILILTVIDWFGIDWRVGLVAISIDAILTLIPFFAHRSAHDNRTT